MEYLQEAGNYSLQRRKDNEDIKKQVLGIFTNGIYKSLRETE